MDRGDAEKITGTSISWLVKVGMAGKGVRFGKLARDEMRGLITLGSGVRLLRIYARGLKLAS